MSETSAGLPKLSLSNTLGFTCVNRAEGIRKRKTTIKAKVKARGNTLVPVQLQVKVVLYAVQRSTGLPIVHRTAGGLIVPRRAEQNSAGMKRLWVSVRTAAVATNTSTKGTLSLIPA